MAFLPLHDDNPRVVIAYPWVTWGLIAACVIAFVYENSGGDALFRHLIYGYGLIPAVLTGEAELGADLYEVPALVTLVSSLFLHSSIWHLIGNMLYLWVFGDNIEDAMGHIKFLMFYMICGIIAGLAQVVADPDSVVPTIGASGAISGVLGAYLILHPRARVLIPIFIIPVYVPAFLLLLFWIGFQVFAVLGAGVSGGGVAWLAHIGGFVAGAALIALFRRKTMPLLGDRPPVGLRLRTGFRTRRRKDGPKDRRPGPWS
jgi:membrane associated rhomboid family serine protease